MAELSISEFDWGLHSELVKGFHEDLVLLSFPHGHMPREDFLELFRSSDKDGLPAYTRVLREAYDEGVDGMFVWEMDGEAVGWSWLRVHENEFFPEGVYGEICEIHIVPGRRGEGIGTRMMIHAFDWLRARGVNTARVETAATNVAALRLYERFGFEPNYVVLQAELGEGG